MTERAKIAALDGGPSLVRGSVVVDAWGNEFYSERKTMAFGRCGGATTKPFCDGTHSKVGLRAAERAAGEEEGQGR